MRLSAEVFAIEAAVVSLRIEGFIANAMSELRRDGVVVTMSGGLDSSTVAALAVRAVGADRVTGLLLPEKQGNPDARRYALLMAGQLGIGTQTFDLSPLLERIGAYRFPLARIPVRAVREVAVKGYLALTRANPYVQGLRGEGSSLFRKGFSSSNVKHRMRLVATYRFAEENNLLVVGCAHKSEDLVGLFVKYGVDDCADVMPLKNLYRSHILQLASYVGVPQEIIERTPNPDILAGISDKYYDVLGLKADVLDLILFGLIEAGLSCSEIADALGLDEGKVTEIEEIVSLTSHMRNHSQAPSWESLSG
jgi:NAD+ synthase